MTCAIMPLGLAGPIETAWIDAGFIPSRPNPNDPMRPERSLFLSIYDSDPAARIGDAVVITAPWDLGPNGGPMTEGGNPPIASLHVRSTHALPEVWRRDGDSG
jgi:hypothetical protein